ncbi:hypothetical protein ACLOJK_031796 [Asimina triloba]
MVRAKTALIWVASLALLSSCLVDAIGVNWGTMMSHHMLPSTVIQMLKSNGINKVKLFDADSWIIESLAGTGIEVMVAIPNDMLEMVNDYGNAKDWVKENVTRHNIKSKDGVKIKYVAVGNEPFLESYNGSFKDSTFPALKNIQKALNEAGIGDTVKATIPLNADVYNSPAHEPVPSTGNFRSDIRKLMVSIVRFLHTHKAPFVVNIYPFLSLYQNPDFPVSFAFFDSGGKSIRDGQSQYNNVLDANFDTLVWSLKKAGVPNMKIVVGEVGWPTDGDKNANVENARKFYRGLLKKLASKKGTPMRPEPMDVYLFGLFDEDMKSVAPGDFERHWGIYRYDGKPKFHMDLSGEGKEKYLVAAKGVQYLPKQWCVLDEDSPNLNLLPTNMDYACTFGDCTSLGYGSSCNNLDLHGNASYAFNMYFQIQDQDVTACDFQGLAKITTKNASQGTCLFPIQIMNAGVPTRSVPPAVIISVLAAVLALFALLAL